MQRFTDGATPIDIVRQAAKPLAGRTSDWDALLDPIGDARFVLIGEASHGTHDFYATRAEITKRLIAERGFSAVVAEADWPDAYRVNCYVRGAGDDPTANDALSGFQRFPAWMWRNRVVEEFIDWLREHNAGVSDDRQRVGFYGMDLYSLNASIAAVIGYLNSVDPDAARRAQERYSCFEFFNHDPETYGYATSSGAAEDCEDAVIEQLREMQRRGDFLGQGGTLAEDDEFAAEQNARLVANAEEYYRSMFRGRASSWNLRDRHMVETIGALSDYLGRHDAEPKLVVWAHNSHLGDARATEMGRGGEWNVGQLVRERWGEAAFLLGFSTHAGTVTAATNWGDAAQTKTVVASLDGSYERLFHETGIDRFILNIRDDERLRAALRTERLERAIGVIYRPETERTSHYFLANLAEQFDALIHLDTTRALEPLEPYAPLPEHELPETYPSTE
jgi:erythromycin esterase-like protein